MSTEASGAGAIAASGSIGQAFTGANAVGMYYTERSLTVPPETFALPDSAPAATVHLPARNDLFVGRRRELDLLDEAFGETGGVVVQAVHGLGGIGKSTLAAQWAARHTDDFNPVWWIPAETPGELDTGLAELAVALQPPLRDILSRDALRDQALRWLSAHDGWLLILDNVVDPADIEPLLARATRGRVLVTTRRATGWHGVVARSVRLDVLEADEAVELFTRILALADVHEVDGAADVCAELGHLPLAVEQAAAYCADAAMPPYEYLDLLTRYPADLYGHGRPAIGRTWRVTLDRLTAEDPLTARILRVLAWFAPDGIPRALLDGLADRPRLMRAIGRLASHSMIRTHEKGFLSVHRLVQDVSRTADESDAEEGDPHRRSADIDAALETAIDLLNQVQPRWQQEEDWPAWALLLPHIVALAEHLPTGAEAARLVRVLHAFVPVLSESGAFALYHKGYELAFDLLRPAVDICELYPGDDRARERVIARNSLGQAYAALGDVRTGMAQVEQALADAEQHLGKEDRDTLTVRVTLANQHRDIGQVDEAVRLLERVLADIERTVGADSLDAHWARCNLGTAYRTVGRTDAARRLLTRSVAEGVRLLGEDHSHVIMLRSALGQTHLDAGKISRAVAVSERALADARARFGAHHPTMVEVLRGLARVYVEAGRRDEAVPLLEEALEAAADSLGDDHPETIALRNNLGATLADVGDRERATELLQQALRDCRRAYGDEDERTRTTWMNVLKVMG